MIQLIDDLLQGQVNSETISALITIGISLVILYLLYRVARFLFIKIKERKYQKKLATSGIRDIDRMDGLQFEEYLKALFQELGYKAQKTKGSNDFGADIVLTNSKQKVVVQAKRYKYKSNVGVDAIQQVYTAIPFYNAHTAWVLTNSFYTKNAQKLAQAVGVTLLDRYKLIEFINKVNPEVTPEKIKKTVKPEERECPSCDGKLVVRYNNKNGNSFMGCTNYPACQHTEQVAK